MRRCHALSCFIMVHHGSSCDFLFFEIVRICTYIYNYTILYVYPSRDMTWLSFDPCLRQVILSWIFLSHLLKKTATPAEASGTPVIPRSAGSRQPEMEHTGCTVIRALATNNHWYTIDKGLLIEITNAAGEVTLGWGLFESSGHLRGLHPFPGRTIWKINAMM